MEWLPDSEPDDRLLDGDESDELIEFDVLLDGLESLEPLLLELIDD